MLRFVLFFSFAIAGIGSARAEEIECFYSIGKEFLTSQQNVDNWLKDPDDLQWTRYGAIVRGQDDGGDGAGAAAATDPSVPLTQLQLQNVFVPRTFDANGYSNQVVIQPVLPIHLNSDFFPYHIMRPTLPIVSPTADPVGPAGVTGGLGDLLLLDAYVHPIKEWKTNLGVGYAAIFPTATDLQLGLREWQLGPAAFAVTTAVPKWVLGVIYQQPFSLESNAYTIQVQPIATRLLPDQWYIGWGDLLWTLDNQNNNYDLPLNLKLGKIVKVGRQPLNVFVEPFYTPEGLRRGPAIEWGVKLNVTFLFPQTKLGPLFGTECCCQ